MMVSGIWTRMATGIIMNMPLERLMEKNKVDMKFKIEQEHGPSFNLRKEKVTVVIGLMIWKVNGNLGLTIKNMMMKVALVIGLKVSMGNIHSSHMKKSKM